MTGNIRSLSAIDGVLVRRAIRVTTPDPVGGGDTPTTPTLLAGLPEDVSTSVYRTTLNWKANYSADTAALVASYSGPDQDIKLATPGSSITLVSDPIDPLSTRKFMKTTQPNGTATTNGVTANPRMQIEDPRRVIEGDEYWTAQTYIFPTDWPVVGLFDGYIQVFQFYGEPFGGGATITLTFRADGPYDTPDVLRWGFNRDNSNIATGLAWKWQTVRGAKMDLAFRIRAGRKDPRTNDDAVPPIFFPAKGTVEIWLNMGDGWVQQTLIGGVKRLACAVIGEVNTVGPNSNEIQLYRRLDEFPQDLIHYVGGHARGRTLASVDPRSFVTIKAPVPNFVYGTTKPTANNTGVGTLIDVVGAAARPAPTVVFDGDITLTGGQTLKDLIVKGRVICTGANNIIENCEIVGNLVAPTVKSYLVQTSSSTNTIIRHCDLRPQTLSRFWNSVGEKNYTVERCSLADIVSGFVARSTSTDRLCKVKIRGNFGRNMIQFRPDGTLFESQNDWVHLQSNVADVNDVLVEGNHFNARHVLAINSDTGAFITSNQLRRSCIRLTPLTGSTVSGSFLNNWFDGGVNTFDGAAAKAGSQVTISGNRFERPSASVGGVTLSIQLDSAVTRVNVSSNVYSDNGEVVPITTAAAPVNNRNLAFWGLPTYEDNFDYVDATGAKVVDPSKWNLRPRSDLGLTFDAAETRNEQITVDSFNILHIKGEWMDVPKASNRPAGQIQTLTHWTGYMDHRPLRAGNFTYAQQYGRWEIRAKVPTGPNTYGALPAFWLRNAQSGEIDIMESWGYASLPNGLGQFPGGSSLTSHTQTSGTGNIKKIYRPLVILGNGSAANTEPTPPVYNDFHVWALEWTPTYFRAYYDDKLYINETPTSYPLLWDQSIWGTPNHVRLNLHVGPSPDYWGLPDPNNRQWTQLLDYQIDYVRIWAMP